MSTVRANNYYDASGGSAAQLYGVSMRNGGTGWVNRIINGEMTIDQRNAGASVNPVSGQYLLDRYVTYRTQASKFTVQQNAGAITPPQGFSNYLGVTSSSAYSLLSTDFFVFGQHIEAFNYADLGWGTANAQTVTLSFWVRSSLTGTFGGSLINGSDNYSYPYSYTINAANTWEYKTITIAGPTAGTWAGATNGIGITLFFSLGTNSNRSAAAGSWIAAGGSGSYLSATGATSVVGTNGATFYLAGVQFEAGTVASPFERRDYGRELIMCQRYCQAFGGTAVYESVGYGNAISATVVNTVLALPVPMRVQPSSTQVGTWQVSDGTAGFSASNLSVQGLLSGTQQIMLGITSSGLTTLRTYRIEAANSTASRLILSAEL